MEKKEMSVGKNFSGNTGMVKGFRKKSDFYETPFSITEQLLEREHFKGTILEPCSGGGAIMKVLLENYMLENLTDYDLDNDGLDFFAETRKYDYIITNPPFSKAHEWILKCKEVAEYKFALLLPLSYLHGEKRYKEIYQDKEFPLARVYVFTRYPMLGDKLRMDGKYRTGMMVYAWFVWDKFHTGQPTIQWISNQDHILSKKDEEQ